MEIFGFVVPESIISFITFIFPYFLIVIILFAVIRFLTKKKDYFGKAIEIKEAPLNISNLLRDHVKRQIIRTLKKQRKYLSSISKEINENAPRTRYHLKQIEKASLVKSFKLARETYFSLTKKGQWCLGAMNFYYPSTNIQLLISRLKKFLGVFG